MTYDPLDEVHRVYKEVQIIEYQELTVPKEQLEDFSSSWKNDEVPSLQRKVVDIQLDNLRKGLIDPVFLSLITALKEVKLTTFTLLDAACATGYYFEVIKTLDKRDINYMGCDYSEAMIEAARTYYPGVEFQVQDLTELTYPSRSIDVVLISGVLEHIPDYQKAIAEACRVAKDYIIVHRCPLISSSEHVYTVGSQYNIRTPRIYFSERKLVDELQAQHFSLIRQSDTYGQTNLQRIKSFIKRIVLWSKIMKRQRDRKVNIRTLVFKYKRQGLEV